MTAPPGGSRQPAAATIPGLFFPIGKAGRAVTEIQRAKAVCAVCPVQAECLAFALETHQAYGIWGGYDEDERRRQRRQQQRRLT